MLIKYIAYGVRINWIYLLISAATGLREHDNQFLDDIKSLNKRVQLVITKTDKIGKQELNQVLVKTSLETQKYKHVFPEI